MSQPVVYNSMHIWVADTGVYTLPLYRVAGIYAPANGEFSTKVGMILCSGMLRAEAHAHFSVCFYLSACLPVSIRRWS